jgi:uncharacterized protein (TIGR03382 family)
VNAEAPLCQTPAGHASALQVPGGPPVPEGFSVEVYVLLLAARASAGWEGCRDAVATARPTADCLLSLTTFQVSSAEHPVVNPAVHPLEVVGRTEDATLVIPVGDAASDLAQLEVVLSVAVDATSVESLFTQDASVTEIALDVAWFTTCGSISGRGSWLDAAPTRSVRCTPPADGVGPVTCTPAEAVWKPGEAGDCTVHAVVRNGSGGLSYVTQAFQVSGMDVPEDEGKQRRFDCGCSTDPGSVPGLLVWALLLGWWLRRRS